MCDCGFCPLFKWFNRGTPDNISDVELTRTGETTPAYETASSISAEGYDPTQGLDMTEEVPSQLEDLSELQLWLRANIQIVNSPIAPVPIPIPSSPRPSAAVLFRPETSTSTMAQEASGAAAVLDNGMFDNENDLSNVVEELETGFFAMDMESDGDEDEDELFPVYDPNSPAGRYFLDAIRQAFCMELATPFDTIRSFIEKNGNILRHLISATVPHPGNYVRDAENDGIYEPRMSPAAAHAARRLVLHISSIDWNSERIADLLTTIYDQREYQGLQFKEFLRKHRMGERSQKAIRHLRRTNDNFRNSDDFYRHMKKLARKNRGKSRMNQQLSHSASETSEAEGNNGQGSSKKA